ncbi:MAG: hypothetical protein DRJ03_04720 [Chloroflexi bacterium]|nr:MAG: hypothetical protein DRJ03_04720 [Chloroflexota bacterium]
MVIFDTETCPIGPAGTGWPDFVCMGWVAYDHPFQHTDNKEWARDYIQFALDQGEVVVAHNAIFDLSVLGVELKEGHKIHDTMIVDLLQQLSENDCDMFYPGPPTFRGLGVLLGKELEGKGTTQLSFKPDVPLTPKQLKYLESDVRATETVYKRQCKRHIPGGFPQILLQVKAGIGLQNMTTQGMRVDLKEVGRQKINMSKIKRRSAHVLKSAGMYVPAHVGKRGGKYKAKLNTKVFKEHVVKLCEKNKLEVAKTTKGQVSTAGEFLKSLPKDQLVDTWLDYKNSEKMIGTFLDKWTAPAGRIHPRFRLLMRTGRTSSFKPNFQQIPARGEKAQMKKVFLPEEGQQLWEIDYSQLELCCLAYLTQGVMLKMINAGEDLHLNLASVYFGKDKGEVTKAERQLMKCANFGLPGGMGPTSFRKFVRTGGHPDPGEEGARSMINAWMATYPEMEEWRKDDCEIDNRWLVDVWSGRDEEFKDEDWEQALDRAYSLRRFHQIPIPNWVRKAINRQEGSFRLARWLCYRRVTVPSGRCRAPLSYTEAHNAKFQGLAADLNKVALGFIMDIKDIAVHSFVHDAFVFSCKDESKAREVAKAMLRAATVCLPNVKVEVEASGPGVNWFDAKQQAGFKLNVQSLK